jgi:hypothetical protein
MVYFAGNPLLIAFKEPSLWLSHIAARMCIHVLVVQITEGWTAGIEKGERE